MTDVVEFYAPFAHVPGKYEWCKIRSPTHGVFDTFVLLGNSVHEPATVYVRDDRGFDFMVDRYPECAAIRVPTQALRIEERAEGRTVIGHLRSLDGPVRAADMTIAAPASATPRAVPYGGDRKPVWGSKRFTCEGVDLALDGFADGQIQFADKHAPTELRRVPAVVTLGSYGRITEF